MNFHAMTRNELEQALVGPHAEGAEGVLVLDYHWKCLRLAPGQLLHSENCNHDRR